MNDRTPEHPATPGTQQPGTTSENASGLPLVYEPAIQHGSFSSRDARIVEALAYLVGRDDGWLRLIPSRDGALAYAKWKYTAGRHSGKYVMVAVPAWSSLDLLPLLEKKILEVDAGVLRPTLDKYFALD